MLAFGYKMMSEEHGPTALVRNVVAAEKAGFDFAALSDHFSPWLDEQGHSPFAWSVLGAAAQATNRIGLMTAVTCPTMRYHPAVIAQAAATIGILSNNRFTLGLGAGERLNEHIVGEGWPGTVERHKRLEEATEVITMLLTGAARNYHGRYFKLDHASLFDRPERVPGLAIAAGGDLAAGLAARAGASLIATEPKHELVAAFTASGGTGARFAEVAMCYAETEEKAKQIAHRYFRWSLTGWPVMAELPDTAAFAAASQYITADAVAEKISCGPSAKAHRAAIERYIDAGFDHLILTQIGPDQEQFITFFEQELAPLLR